MDHIFISIPCLPYWLCPTSFGACRQTCRTWNHQLSHNTRVIRHILECKFPLVHETLLCETPDDWLPTNFLERLPRILNETIVFDGNHIPEYVWKKWPEFASSMPPFIKIFQKIVSHGFIVADATDFEPSTTKFEVSPALRLYHEILEDETFHNVSQFEPENTDWILSEVLPWTMQFKIDSCRPFTNDNLRQLLVCHLQSIVAEKAVMLIEGDAYFLFKK